MIQPIARAVALLLVAPAATTEALPLPESLTGLNTSAGRRLLQRSEAQEAFLPLVSQFVTQKSQTYCGVASVVMVLNALGFPGSETPASKPFRTFTQENLFTAPVRAVVTPWRVSRRGMSLPQLGDVLAAHPVAVEVRQARHSSLEEFRALARDHLGRERHFVIVNYLCESIGQDPGAHISPLAAYDRDTDRFLILDVARYKYPPVWVEAAALFSAMNTVAVAATGRTRGYVLVSPRPAS